MRCHSSAANRSAHVSRTQLPLFLCSPTSATWVTPKATSAMPGMLWSSLSQWFVKPLGQRAAPVWPSGSATALFLKSLAWSPAHSGGAIVGVAWSANCNIQAAACGASLTWARTLAGPREYETCLSADRVGFFEQPTLITTGTQVDGAVSAWAGTHVKHTGSTFAPAGGLTSPRVEEVGDQRGGDP